MIIKRNYAEIEKPDLEELLQGSIEKLKGYFINGKGTKWSTLYNISEPLCSALCQGAAMHYYDKKNGIKDFDIWFFYPFNQKHLPYRTVWKWDYQNPKFGKNKKVDVIVRSIRDYNLSDPIGTMKKYLSEKRTDSAQALSKKALVVLSPKEYLGETIWYKNTATQ